MSGMGDDADELLGGVLATQMLHVERAVALGEALPLLVDEERQMCE